MGVLTKMMTTTTSTSTSLAPPLSQASKAAALRMEQDADMLREKEQMKCPMAAPLERGVFVVVYGSQRATEKSAAIVKAVGLEKLEDMTQRFYKKAFADPHLDTFIREHDDHHGRRFALWIYEKLGGGNVWTAERKTRKVCPFHAHGHQLQSAYDRSSAHFAAWHSPKRDPAVWGEHFNLYDCRRWMRLHFWAMREAGICEQFPEFADLYTRVIGHFVSVYEHTAPPFARESLRWSADPKNTERYEQTKEMPDIMNISFPQALNQLPASERQYTGSRAASKIWPYERM